MQPAARMPPAAPPPFPVLAPSAFSVGGVIGKTFSTWAKNLLPFTVLSLLVQLPMYATSLWNQYAIYGGYPSFQQMAERAREQAAAGAGPFAQFTPLVVTGWLVMWVLMLVQMGALTYGAIQHLAGRKVSVGPLIGAGFRRVWTVFVTGLVSGLVVMLGMTLFIVPGIILACGLAVAIPVVMAEGKGAFAAIGRSFALTKGKRFAIFLAFFVMLLVVWTTSALSGLLPLALGGGTASLVGGVVALLVAALFAPLGTLLPAVVYHDLRVAKEGVATADLVKVFE
ncbi:MAG TPA: hypothetical protein VLU43_15250 [Anaeromyxobacteraceae bacterium]|nr:hypothetical protein [Anaeromyxobacteraceae bacterium]